MKKVIFVLLAVILHTQSFSFGPSSLLLKDGSKYKAGDKYWLNSEDGLYFSFLNAPGNPSNIRFSAFFNLGAQYNYNITSKVALTTGADIKNLGFSSRGNGQVFRARNYYAGVPLGLRIGNFKKKTEIMFGAGLDYGFHYKAKQWTIGDKGDSKTKYSEWASNLTNNVMPNIYAGFKVKGVGIKWHYQLKSFYKNGNANLMYFGLLFDSPASNKSTTNKIKKIRKPNNTID